jgi:hypothetical protein
MAFSEMNAREKTIVVILGVVILIALIGIGVLVSRLVAGDKETAGVTVSPTEAIAVEPSPTITLVAAPAPDEAVETTPAPMSARPLIVAQEQSPGTSLPVLLTNFSLHAGHVYRLEITAADGSSTAIQGSWSQGATGADGTVQTTLPEFFEATTPFSVDLVAPVAQPTSWSVSASASAQNLLGASPILVITVYDVTGSQ